MPNFNNWRNWGTNILIRLGLQDQHYAHAFATVDPVYEPEEEEEVDLAPTMFEWRIWRSVKRAARSVYKAVVKPVVKKAKNIVKDTAKTTAKVYKAVAKPVVETVQKVTKPLDKAINVVKQPVQNVAKDIGSYDYKKKASNIAKDVGKTADKVGANIKRGAEEVVDTAGKVVSAVGRGVKDVVKDPVGSVANVLTFGGVDREREKAKKEYAAAALDHNEAQAAYTAGQAQIKKDTEAARAKYAAQKAASSKSAAESKSKLDKATAYRAEAKATGERTYAAQRNVSKQGEFLASQTLRKAQEESAKRKQVKESKGSGPGYTGVTIKPGSALPTGKVRSKSKSKKELVEKSKSGGLGGL